MRRPIHLIYVATRSALIILAAFSAVCSSQGGVEEQLPPLYVTIIVHSEEDLSRGVLPKSNIPDYDGDEALMHHFADAMRAFAKMVAEHGAHINFGSDWTFSRGVAQFEPDFYADLEAMGHEVDAHAHESSIRYHEVREEIVFAGGAPTHVASGMDETEIQEQLLYFDRFFPEFQILWGISLPGHTAGECTAAWVWRPSRQDWTTHDARGRYIFIGHGELVNSIQAVRQAVERRDPDRVNSIALFVSPREFLAAEGAEGIASQWTASTDSLPYWEQRIAWWDHLFEQIEPLIETGAVRYATLTEIAAVFVQQEDSLSFNWSGVPRSDASLRQRNVRAGYPLE